MPFTTDAIEVWIARAKDEQGEDKPFGAWGALMRCGPYTRRLKAETLHALGSDDSLSVHLPGIVETIRAVKKPLPLTITLVTEKEETDESETKKGPWDLVLGELGRWSGAEGPEVIERFMQAVAGYGASLSIRFEGKGMSPDASSAVEIALESIRDIQRKNKKDEKTE